MEQEFRTIDLADYPRREHFAYFRSLAYPYVGTTCEVDITAFLKRTQAQARPFFLSFLWHAARAANAVPEFRQRIKDGGIVEYRSCPTSHTVAKPDGTYAYCTLKADISLADFLPVAAAEQERAKNVGNVLEESGDALPLLFISTAPWLSYTAIVQPVPSPADSNPRITWGKYRAAGDRTLMPVSVLCNHALVDGLHIAAFYRELARSLDTAE